MRHVVVFSLAVVWIVGCGVIQVKPENTYRSAPTSLDVPPNTDPRIKNAWDHGEAMRERVLRDENRSQLISFDKYYGACKWYVEVFQIDPAFATGPAFQKVTVRDRMKEICQRAIDYSMKCRAQGTAQGCGEAATVTSLIALIEGGTVPQPQATAASQPVGAAWQSGAAPLVPPDVRNAEAQQQLVGEHLGAQMTEISGASTSKRISDCDALDRIAAIEAQIPPDLRELHRAIMNFERLPPEVLPGVGSPEEIEAARHATGERRIALRAVTEMYLISITPPYQQGLVSTLCAIDRLRENVYKRTAVAALTPDGIRKNVLIAKLREWAETFRCLGSYTPVPQYRRGAEVAQILDVEVARVAAELQAQAEEEARCLADPACVNQREVVAVAGELCPILDEIDAIDMQLKARLREAKKYGVINKADQYSDMEYKQSFEERAAELKERYQQAAGKKFSRKVCADYVYEVE